jgi:hypothetical protein
VSGAIDKSVRGPRWLLVPRLQLEFLEVADQV